MKLLIISSSIPMPDRASGDLRLFSILSILSKKHQLTLVITASSYQKKVLGTDIYNAYAEQLIKNNVTLSTKCQETIKKETFDCIFFEFYYSCNKLKLMDIARFYQPNAIIIIDSVDVHFKRLEAKAKLTQLNDDFLKASTVKKEELNVYRNSDVVLAVTKEDQNILQLTCPKITTFIIPNIYKIPTFAEKKPSTPIKLLFIGGFNHPPNIDAMLFFCLEVMPLLRTHLKGIQLSIVGSSPTTDIYSLENEYIKVTGFVPSVAPYYKEADIVIAPLRYGGGMKGKVGEAFSYSTPVVTTDFGAEGFDISPDVHFLLANSPDEYLKAIQNLSSNVDFYHNIARNAWEFIHDNYSNDKATITIEEIFEKISSIEAKKLAFLKRIKIISINFLNKHILWRFK